MIRQCPAPIEYEVIFFYKPDRTFTAQLQAARGANVFDSSGDLIGIDSLRVFAFQSQQNGDVGAMAFAGCAQRPVQLDTQAVYKLRYTLFTDVRDKRVGRAHGPHCM